LDIRPAGPDDVAVLVRAFGQEKFFKDRLGRQVAGRGMVLTAWLATQPVGAVYLWQELAEEPEIRRHLPMVPLLNHLEVLPAWRNQGIGTGLIHAAERILAESGARTVALAVELRNTDAERLYLRLGYRRWGLPPVACLTDISSNGYRASTVEVCNVLVKVLTGGS
jgi:GNAT superfamily N-acetyltransferase